MDEKMKEAMKNLYDSLTDGQKEKWDACKTEEEFTKFLSDEGIELPDGLVDAVAGGWAGVVTKPRPISSIKRQKIL